MSADHGDGVAGFPCCADCEGYDGAGVAGEVILAAGLQGGGPGVSFLPGTVSGATGPVEMGRMVVDTLMGLNPAFSRRCAALRTAWKATTTRQPI